MNARDGRRPQTVDDYPREPLHFIEFVGVRGKRYTDSEVARALGVMPYQVRDWIRAGWLRGNIDAKGIYRIRHKSVRRALRDWPQVVAQVMKARER